MGCWQFLVHGAVLEIRSDYLGECLAEHRYSIKCWLLLLEYELIEEAGRMDAPGRPTMYKVSPKFFKMFGIESLEELPELPRYKLDENQQIVLDEYIEEQEKEKENQSEGNVAEDSTEEKAENSEN